MSIEIKKLNKNISVTGQITADDIAEIKAQGFTTIINNRDDGEIERQPSAASIRAVVEQAGLAYAHLPIEPGKPTDEAINGFGQALNKSSGTVLAHCGTGLRATVLWALSQVGHQSADELIKAADQAGYDISAMRQRLS
jgi:sulfide:quinone oxidoreductase